MLFADRVDAGQRLAMLLLPYRDESPIVLGLPRGGVPVAFEVARALKAPLDVLVVRKVGAPDQPELGLGAIAEGGALYLDHQLMRQVGASETEVAEIAERKAAEVVERVRLFRGARPQPDVRGRTVILVDDGIATGGTVHAAVKALRALEPRRIVLAVPVSSSQALDALAGEVDECVCVETSDHLGAIGLFYEDFTQTTDQEVVQLIERARGWLGPRLEEQPPAP